MAVEKEKLASFVRGVLEGGGPCDRECLQHLAVTIMTENRQSGEVIPEVSKQWAYGFRKANGLTKLRLPSSDRPVDTAADIELDNQWRSTLREVLAEPQKFNLVVPGGGSLPEACVLGIDETPGCYLPRSVWLTYHIPFTFRFRTRTYAQGKSRRVYYLNANVKIH